MSRNIIDLFSGTGGFSLGAHYAGFTDEIAIDIDPILTSSFKTNFPNADILLGDISELNIKDIYKSTNKNWKSLDGIVGGPPCQGYSLIGNRDPSDPRNSLVFHFFRMIKESSPKFFIMENVPGILDPRFLHHLTDGLNLVASKYEILEPLRINAADFGAATSRERVIFIGYRKDYVDPITHNDIRRRMVKKRNTVRTAISDLPLLKNATSDETGQFWAKYTKRQESIKNSPYIYAARKRPISGLADKTARQAHAAKLISGFQPTLHTENVLRRMKDVIPGKHDPISKCPRLSWDGLCPTLRAGTGSDRGSHQSIRPIHPKEDRVITVREAARLQGFPDWFQFHPTIWHSFRMIGNSVSPYISNKLLKLIAEKY
ncbi:MAG: DNA cytosine methyltransferase [Pseudomonadota bacterium]|nr:DNA cytosine methyltransferase [Pseudomonadota bacterium]